MQLMGGAENYDNKLDQHFSGGENVHSNEPSHYGYLYDFGGQPWKTQAMVRKIAGKRVRRMREALTETTIAVRCPRGFSSQRWASIRESGEWRVHDEVRCIVRSHSHSSMAKHFAWKQATTPPKMSIFNLRP